MPSLRSQPELVPSPRGPLPKWCALGVAVVSMVMATILFQETVVGWVCVAVLLLSLSLYNNKRFEYAHIILKSLYQYSVVLMLIPVYQSKLRGKTVLCSLCVQVLSEVELSDICETRQMNVAHGLAWSFYLGYLQLVLPQAISAFCASHQSSASLWSRGSKRLFILIPINANISHKLENEDERVHFYDSLPNSQLDRGGVRGRVYKHSVYRVFNHKGQAHDCVLEYATPLLTLHSMSQDRSAAFGEPQRREQVLLFYRTLRDILERSLECRNRYTLILLNDEHEGDPHYLSKCILRHLHQQDTEEYPILPSPRIHPPQPEQTPLTAQGQHMGAWGGHRGQDLSKDPTLMFSTDTPRTLRGPVETSDGFKPKHNGYS
uniref:Stimulator of interferon genes protein n=1 Tax=Periophthalmus magnuspinnatus TaxID=409849 RepID=A0A3B3ZLF8_9GOBI